MDYEICYCTGKLFCQGAVILCRRKQYILLYIEFLRTAKRKRLIKS